MLIEPSGFSSTFEFEKLLRQKLNVPCPYPPPGVNKVPTPPRISEVAQKEALSFANASINSGDSTEQPPISDSEIKKDTQNKNLFTRVPL